MLPPEIKKLAEQAIKNEVSKYNTATQEAIKQVSFEYTKKGTRKSTMFNQADRECRVKTFMDFGQNIANAISQLHFVPPANCEDDLVSIVHTAMIHAMELQVSNYSGDSSMGRDMHATAIQFNCEQVIKDTETKIRIHVQSLRHQDQQRTSNTNNIIIGDGNNLQAGNANTIETTTLPPSPEKKAIWEKGTFWGTVALVAIALVTLYFIVWPPKPESEPPAKPTIEKSNTINGNNNGNLAIVNGSPNAQVTQVYNPQPPPEILETKTLTTNEETHGIFKTVFQLRIGNLPYDMRALRVNWSSQTDRRYVLYLTNFYQESSGTYITQDSMGRSVQFQKFNLDVLSSKAINPNTFVFTVTNRPRPQ